MGISYTKVREAPVANQRRVVLDAAFDTSYTAGGEALAADDARLGSVELVTVGSGASESGYVPRYDAESESLLMFEENGNAGPLAEVADATDLSTETVRLVVWGRS